MSSEELHCTIHPDRTTLLRCGKCERPFCIDCLVQTPVGLRCRECANIRRLPIYEVSVARLAWVTLVGLVAAVLGGILFFGVVGAFSLWLSPLYGLGIGEVIRWTANRKRGPNLQLAAGFCIVVGAILGKYGLALLSLLAAGSDRLGLVAEAAGRDIWLMLFVVIAVVAGISRVR
ncbi:MAG: B-box zinc finger protein [Chloroflexi bacterium]|nr:B-box zinc finger protein [Chloroflexota bacterium]